MQNNSSSSKAVGVVLVILIIIAGVWLMVRNSKTDYSDTMMPAAAGSGASNTGTTGVSESSSTGTAQVGDSSDSALAADSAQIDAEMNGLTADTAAAGNAQ